jgi:TPR repeat protein
MKIKDTEFEKMKERHEAPRDGCMFYILSFVGVTIASLVLADATADFFPAKYRGDLYLWIFSLGFLGLAAWGSERADKKRRLFDLKLWLKYDYPSLLENASSGNSDAQYWLGRGVNHHGCAKECGPALFWLLMAANQGHFKAQEYVAILYQNGEGVPKDPEKAAYWFSKAAANRPPES